MSVRDAVLGVEVVNGKGEQMRFGGQVMKNVAGYDVARLMTGSYGALGIVFGGQFSVFSLKSSMLLPYKLSWVQKTPYSFAILWRDNICL